MNNMVDPFLRSARTGNNLLLIDQSIAGVSGPGSPESFLTQNHAQVIFMMVVAQTVNPGIACIHCGIPSVIGQAAIFLTVLPTKRSSTLPWRGSIPGLQVSLPPRPEAVPVCRM
jgi:hypothetical protein